MKTLTFKVWHDPGHAWIKCSKKRLVRFFGEHWRKEFTPYSFEKGDYVYLEEDDDASTLIKRLKENGITPVWDSHYNQTKYSKIRNYPRLSPI